MNPFQYVAKAFNTNPQAAKFLTGGALALAIAAVVVGWGIDANALIFIAAVIVIFAVVVFALHSLPRAARGLLGWSFTVFLVVWLGATLVSGLLPGLTPLPPASCILQIHRDCGDVVAAKAANDEGRTTITPSDVTPAADLPGAVSVALGSYSVKLHFAGSIRRADSTALTMALAESGWNVPQSEKGGERQSEAAGFNEVRYGSLADKAAAALLAGQVVSAGIVETTVTTKQMSSLPAKSLEIWISR